MVLSTSPRSPAVDPPESGVVPSGPSDAEAADPATLSVLVGEHLDFVWRSLRRFGVLEADVDDATQRVFMIASQKLLVIQKGSERSFLVGVAARIAGHSRRSYRRREAAERSFSTHPRAPNPNPEELTQKLEDRALLDRVLDGLSEDLRTVFVLFELEELSIDDIAHLLSLPRGTAASRLRRAREVFHAQARLLSAAGPVRKGTP
jgi:RNA polymerase sigma-70 factor (ECF subfamily)